MNPERSRSQIISAVMGFLMMAVSAPCVIGMIHDLMTQTANAQGALVAGTFFAFVGVFGAFLMWTGLRKPPAKQFVVSQELERQVLGLARQHGGRLTVTELALETSMTLDECSNVIRHFQRQEVIRVHLSDEGDEVYVFPGFTVDKASAIDPLDDRAVFDAQLADVDSEEEVAFAQPQEAKQEDW